MGPLVVKCDLQFKLQFKLFSGEQKRIQRENYGEATKKISYKVYSDEFEDGRKKYNLILKIKRNHCKMEMYAV